MKPTHLVQISLLALVVFIGGCSAKNASKTPFEEATGEKPIKMTLDEMRVINKKRLQKVSLGMTKPEVLAIMGTRTFYQRVPYYLVPNPYRVESLKAADGKIYEIVFYYTDLKKRDDALTDDELTPLAFNDGKLVGWGWSFIEDKTKRLRIEVR